jgi:CDP-diacylglycerol--glycerol-3-phosphate 3-phosphatidyltransferase
MVFILLPDFCGINRIASDLIAAAIFGIASFTDYLDGKIARSQNIVTDFGKFMDPIADKLMVFGAFLCFLVADAYAPYRYIFAIIVFVVLLREFAVTSMRMVASNKAGLVIAAAWLGKVKTTTQMICIVTVLLEPIILPFTPFAEWHILSYATTVIMTVMTLWSGIDYLRQYWPYIGKTE